MIKDEETMRALRQLHDCGVVGLPEPRRNYALVRLRNAGLATMTQRGFPHWKWWVFSLTDDGRRAAAQAFGG